MWDQGENFVATGEGDYEVVLAVNDEDGGGFGNERVRCIEVEVV